MFLEWLKSKALALIGIGVPLKDGKPIHIRSRALATLWRETRHLSHKNFAFLDIDYSPSTKMPSMDFTLWLTERLASKDWAAIKELLALLDNDALASKIVSSANKFAPPPFLSVTPGLLNELMATLILSGRIGWMGADENRKHLRKKLRSHVFASHPFRTAAVDKPGLREPFVYAPGVIAAVLARYPVTFRICVEYTLAGRQKKDGTLRLDESGDYTLRQYGLSIADNLRFFIECGIFTSDSVRVADAYAPHVADWLADLEKVGKIAMRI